MARYKFSSQSKLISNSSTGIKKPLPRERYVSALETKFPHIMNAVQAMWGYQELNIYFRKLAVDERGGRKGFPPEVWDDINMLLCVHQEIVPEKLS